MKIKNICSVSDGLYENHFYEKIFTIMLNMSCQIEDMNNILKTSVKNAS